MSFARCTRPARAPSDQNYDTEADLAKHAAAIDAEAAGGPEAMNTGMPDMSDPVHRPPSDAEREQLAQFLACEQMAAQ